MPENNRKSQVVALDWALRKRLDSIEKERDHSIKCHSIKKKHFIGAYSRSVIDKKKIAKVEKIAKKKRALENEKTQLEHIQIDLHDRINSFMSQLQTKPVIPKITSSDPVSVQYLKKIHKRNILDRLVEEEEERKRKELKELMDSVAKKEHQASGVQNNMLFNMIVNSSSDKQNPIEKSFCVFLDRVKESEPTKKTNFLGNRRI